jgi:hypothetical protein
MRWILIGLCILWGNTHVLKAQQGVERPSVTVEVVPEHQMDDDPLSLCLKAMKYHSDSLRHSFNQEVRFRSNDSFIVYLKQFVAEEASFDMDPGLQTVSFLKSPDGKLRFISWLLADNSGIFQSYGVVQWKNKKKEYQYVWLTEKLIMDTKELENNAYTEGEWPGGLVYAIQKTNEKKEDSYALLSFHGLGRETNRKMIDILTVEKDGQLVFGKAVFQRYADDPDPDYRVVFTYSDQTTMTLRFEQDGKAIVFDHLVAPSEMLRGISEYLVPDGTYGCYVRKKKGFWQRVEDFGSYIFEKRD